MEIYIVVDEVEPLGVSASTRASISATASINNASAILTLVSRKHEEKRCDSVTPTRMVTQPGEQDERVDRDPFVPGPSVTDVQGEVPLLIPELMNKPCKAYFAVTRVCLHSRNPPPHHHQIQKWF